jgi:hypothetical protein
VRRRADHHRHVVATRAAAITSNPSFSTQSAESNRRSNSMRTAGLNPKWPFMTTPADPGFPVFWRLRRRIGRDIAALRHAFSPLPGVPAQAAISHLRIALLRQRNRKSGLQGSWRWRKVLPAWAELYRFQLTAAFGG